MLGIKNKISRTVRSNRTLSRVRHFRGHGIHSPFVYRLKREVFMKRSLSQEADRELYNVLRYAGISHNDAVQLQNLHNYCGYRDFEVRYADGKVLAGNKGGDCRFIVVIAQEDGDSLPVPGPDPESTLVVAEKLRVPNMIFGSGSKAPAECLTIERKRFTLYFNYKNLPRQNYKL